MKTQDIITNEYLKWIMEFADKAGFEDDDQIGRLFRFLLKEWKGISSAWEKVGSQDMGPAGDIETYMLSWIVRGKMKKIILQKDFDGNWTVK